MVEELVMSRVESVACVDSERAFLGGQEPSSWTILDEQQMAGKQALQYPCLRAEQPAGIINEEN